MDRGARMNLCATMERIDLMFAGRLWGPVSDGHFQISGTFAAPDLRPVRIGQRLGRCRSYGRPSKARRG